MQLTGGIGAQANDIAGIGGDFRFVENNTEHLIFIFKWLKDLIYVLQ